jgi:hypothetical protein
MVDVDRLDDLLCSAHVPTPALFRAVMDCGGERLSLLRRSGKLSVIDGLITSGAWTDASLVLVRLATPAWTVRRLIYEDGGWYCSLSRHPAVTAELDDMAEASHEILPLAILRAVVDAVRSGLASTKPMATVPAIRATQDEFICCDNFA